MKIDNIREAKQQAIRFVGAIDRLLASENPDNELYGGKLSGAVRRESMSLTRTLAELRRP